MSAHRSAAVTTFRSGTDAGSSDDTRHYFLKAGALVLLGILIVELGSLFRSIFKNEGTNDTIKNTSLSVFSLAILLAFLELVFTFVPHSHGADQTYGARLWKKKYWYPINQYGFRDNELPKNDSTIFFIGDSFTAGYGINHVENRFSNIVSTELNRQNSVFKIINLGVCGHDTKDEFDTMNRFIAESNIKPKKIVLQYFSNDIDKTAFKNGLTYPEFEPYKEFPHAVRALFKGSFLLNYVYWILPHSVPESYMDFLKKAYTNEAIYGKHLEDLTNFVQYTQENNIELCVLVLPVFQAVKESKTVYTEKIIEYFKKKGVKTIDVAQLCEDLTVKQMIVNANDGHASVLVNQRIGQAVLKILMQKDMLLGINKN